MDEWRGLYIRNTLVALVVALVVVGSTLIWRGLLWWWWGVP